MLPLAELNKDDLRYICKQISASEVRVYFQKFSKDFAKIRPGFRAEKLSDADVVSILSNNTNKLFVSSFVEKYLSGWESQIEKHIHDLVEEGNTYGEALILTLPKSVFCDNIGLYFKVYELPADEKYVGAICDAVSLVEKASNKDEDHNDADAGSDRDLYDELNQRIQELESELTLAVNREKQLSDTVQHLEEGNNSSEQEILRLNTALKEAESSIAEQEAELDHYRYLESYADKDFNQAAYNQFQHVSVGQISRDLSGQIWINRLADIIDGEIIPFFADDTRPHYFENRDKLYWRNGPSQEEEFGVWSWKADLRDTDATKDYITSEFNRYTRITEIIEFPQCKSLSELSSVLVNGFEYTLASSKMLFVCTAPNGTKEGLLCNEADCVINGAYVKLAAAVYMLPHFTIGLSDTIKIGGRRFFRKMNLGIPQSVYRVKTPYDAVKELILSRVTIPALRENGLSKREAQKCKRFLEGIPTQTIVQDLCDSYACTEEEAEQFVKEFIQQADKYLSAEDLDMSILSESLSRNPNMISLCKAQLTEEWEEENEARIAAVNKKINDINESAERAQIEVERAAQEKEKITAQLSQIEQDIAEKEKLAAEVEENVAGRIGQAKKEAADFISRMAFVFPIQNSTVEQRSSASVSYTVSKSVSQAQPIDVIDDIDTFEEELAMNLTRVGYVEAAAVEISQQISFGICNCMPMILGENAGAIAQAVAGTINGQELIEFFFSGQDIDVEEMKKFFTASDRSQLPVCLFHGVLDGYDTRLFNVLSHGVKVWNKRTIVLCSIEGIPPYMIPPGIWNQAIYVDGDDGLENLGGEVQAYRIAMDFENDPDLDEYKAKRKQLQPLRSVLTNIQINQFAKFLSSVNLDLGECKSVINHINIIAKALGAEEEAKAILKEQGLINQ